MTKPIKTIAVIAGCAVVLTLAQTSLALPSYGSNCAMCHTSALGTITIVGNDTTGNPAEGCGTPDLGTRPVFTVAQGGSKTLSGQVSGLPSGANYAAVLKQFEKTGVVSCSTLTYTPDSTWLQRTSPAPTYYTLPLTGNWYSAPGGATSFPFSITVDASTPADYYDLVLAVAGLSGGTFYCESHLYLQVTAAAPPSPTISLDVASLSPVATEGSNPPNDSFSVSNSGGGTLNYTISSDAAWVIVSPTSGSSIGEADPITVQYDAASLAAGSYSGTITVSDPAATNDPQTIAATLTINSVSAPPTISLSVSSLAPVATEGSNPPDDNFTVSNSGGGTLTYTISSDAAWVIVSPTSGSSTGAADPIAVQYDAASLVAGSYSATITVSDPAATNDPQIISVSLTINAPPSGQPTILLSAAALAPSATEGSNPPDDSFTVSNSGGGVLNYTIGSDVAWLVVSPTSGSGTGAADPITVQYDAASLTAGTYSATITVSDPAATNDPQIIDVSLTINSASLPPEILLNVSSLAPSAAEGSNPPDDTFTVTNSGGGTLNYSVSADVAWLIVSPTSGSSTGNSDTITVQYDVASMAVGSYSGTITVSDPAAANDPQTISVSLTISASSSGQPVISLSTSSLSPLTTEDASPPDDSFTVSNTGGGTLNYTVSTAWVAGGPASQHHSPDGDADGDAGGPGDGDADDIPAATWLTVSPTSGSSSGEINTITVHYDTAWLADGTYSATITLSDPAAFNNPQVITIFLTVNEAEDGHNQGSGNEGGSGHDEGSGHDNPPGSSSDQPPSPGQNPGVGCGVGFPAFSMVTLCTLVAIRTGRARRRGHR